MATDMSLLQGELNNEGEAREMDVERLLIGFMRALLEEQRETVPANKSQAEGGTA